MPEKNEVNCSRPSGGVVGEPAPEAADAPLEENATPKGERTMVRVGQKAPDFEAPAFFNGEFTSVKLSDYLGKWVALCFYPGDFTFV